MGGSSPVTAAGPCRTCTGFPILPTLTGRGTSQQFVPPSTLPAGSTQRPGHPGRPGARLAWLLTTSPVTLAIPGTGSLEHLEQNVAAAALQLTDQDLTDLVA
jgi:hypothetical protein